MRARHIFAVALPLAVLVMVDVPSALFTAALVCVPILWLFRGDRAARYGRRRVSMTRLAGPSRFYPCTYCGRPADAWDHVYPWSRGGDDGEGNRTPSCTSCNSSKGDDTPEEWWSRIGHGAPFPAHWPRTGAFR